MNSEEILNHPTVAHLTGIEQDGEASQQPNPHAVKHYK